MCIIIIIIMEYFSLCVSKRYIYERPKCQKIIFTFFLSPFTHSRWQPHENLMGAHKLIIWKTIRMDLTFLLLSLFFYSHSVRLCVLCWNSMAWKNAKIFKWTSVWRYNLVYIIIKKDTLTHVCLTHSLSRTP